MSMLLSVLVVVVVAAVVVVVVVVVVTAVFFSKPLLLSPMLLQSLSNGCKRDETRNGFWLISIDLGKSKSLQNARVQDEAGQKETTIDEDGHGRGHLVVMICKRMVHSGVRRRCLIVETGDHR